MNKKLKKAIIIVLCIVALAILVLGALFAYGEWERQQPPKVSELYGRYELGRTLYNGKRVYPELAVLELKAGDVLMYYNDLNGNGSFEESESSKRSWRVVGSEGNRLKVKIMNMTGTASARYLELEGKSGGNLGQWEFTRVY